MLSLPRMLCSRAALNRVTNRAAAAAYTPSFNSFNASSPLRFESSYKYSWPPPERKPQPINILKDLQSLRRSPAPALVLGLAGLIPFCAAPAYMIHQGVYCPTLASYHLGYGAIILSFLGGVRWGLAVEGESIPQTWLQYGWSVTPSLIGWSALFVPVPIGYSILMAGLGVTCYLDLIETGYPDWFRGLRFLLTLIAVMSLWSALMCKLLTEEKEGLDEKKPVPPQTD